MEKSFFFGDVAQPLKPTVLIRDGHALVKLVSRKQYNGFLTCLNSLSLPEEFSLQVDLPDTHNDIGDVSRLFVTSDSMQHDYDIFRHISVDDSPRGAWQAYLLSSLWHILPMFWHGAYDERTYIFSKGDIRKIKFGCSCESEYLLNQLKLLECDLAPKVSRYTDNAPAHSRGEEYESKYLISCCFWTDWGGLVREIVEVAISNNKFSINDTKYITLLDYNCGICF